MKKVTVSFFCSNYEEMNEAMTALKANSLKSTISDFSDWLRKLSKYEDKETVSVDQAREKLWEIVRENECIDIFD